MNKISTFLWFDGQAEQARDFYASVFKDFRKGRTSYYPEGAPGPAGSLMTAEWEMLGLTFVGLNGGPMFKFSESVSFCINCDDQAEVDYYWDKLLDGGEPSVCGWLKDRFGVSWQVTPKYLTDIITGDDKAKIERVMGAMMKQSKIVIAELETAAREPAHA
jgi:predicted 3-demethylubiquinone-9 3-methyltransferase (glyoxalase superfamily)